MTLRRTTGFLFLFLIGLNSIGYYGLLWMSQQQAEKEMSERLGAFTTDLGSHLMLTLPMNDYTPDSENYQPADGELTYEGVVYHMVKKKVYNHLLYVLCIKDQKSTRVQQSIDDLSAAAAGDQSSPSNPATKITNSVAKYFFSDELLTTPGTAAWERVIGFRTQFCHYFLDIIPEVFHPPLA